MTKLNPQFIKEENEMPNTINIVQPKSEDGTPVSYVTRTNSIFKSDGSPLGDSLDAYMDEVDELSQNLTEYQKKVWNLITTLSGTTGGSYPRTGDYTEMLVSITTSTNKINGVTLPFAENFSGRISLTIDGGVYEIYFNGSGACQGSNANATYRIYYR